MGSDTIIDDHDANNPLRHKPLPTCLVARHHHEGDNVPGEPHPACLSSHIDVDKLDRLKTSGTETYSYDADGNRASVSPRRADE